MPTRPHDARRAFVGWCAIGCVAASAGIGVYRPDEPFWWGGFLRAAFVLGALWLAMPTRDRPAAWTGLRPETLIAVGAVLFLAVRVPRVGLPLVAVLLLLRFLLSPFTRRR